MVLDCKNCDGYEAGYSAGMRDAKFIKVAEPIVSETKDEIFPMKIIAGKCPIDANGDCPLRSQSETKDRYKVVEITGTNDLDWKVKTLTTFDDLDMAASFLLTISNQSPERRFTLMEAR